MIRNHGFYHDSELPPEFCTEPDCEYHRPSLGPTIPIAALTGTLLHRAWLKSGRSDPLIDSDAWDGFALTVQAVATIEQTRGDT